MTHLNLLSKHLLPALLGFIVFLFVVQNLLSELSAFGQQLQWASAVSLFVAALIALQFGRSRLVLCALGLAALPLLLHHAPVAASQLLSVYLLAITWLIWRPDKGLLPINALFTLIEMVVVCWLAWQLLPWLNQWSENSLSSLYSLLARLDPAISQLFTPFEWLTLGIIGVFSLARVTWLPNNTHVAILLSQVYLVAIWIYSQQNFIHIGLIGLAVMFIVAILVDSFNMAFRDELTGIPSRRALMQFVQTLGRKYVVVMSDIDHFKKFNDTYGHDVGDQVLRLVASKLKDVTGGGKAFRYGGEEFTLIFPRKSQHEVLAHVEVLRQIIADYPIVLRGKDRPKHPPKGSAKQKTTSGQKTVHVTCSFGVAEKTNEVKDFMAIIKQADVALYAAKKAGRNCVKQTQ